MEKVVFASNVELYLKDLIDVLFEEEYFGFMSSAIDYVDDLIDFIIKNILSAKQTKTYKELNQFGKFYITYQSNHRTTWYILFDKSQEEVTVTFIFNNHEKFAKYLDL